MRPIASFTDLPSLEAAFTEWYAANVEPKFTQHAAKVAEPVPRESIQWKPAMMTCADAVTFANDLLAEADNWEAQALGILTGEMTVAEAKGKAHRIVRVHKALKRLSESADRKLSALQTINRI